MEFTTLNLFNNFFYYLITCLTWTLVLIILSILCFVLLIVHRFVQLNNNINNIILKTSIKIDENNYKMFMYYYLTSFALLFKVNAMLFIKLYGSLNIINFTIASLILVIFLYFLTSEIVVYSVYIIASSYFKILESIELAIFENLKSNPSNDGDNRRPITEIIETPATDSAVTNRAVKIQNKTIDIWGATRQARNLLVDTTGFSLNRARGFIINTPISCEGLSLYSNQTLYKNIRPYSTKSIARSASIFFGIKFFEYNLVSPQLLDTPLLTRMIVKVWNDLLIPQSIESQQNSLVIQFRFRNSFGMWRNAGPYTSYNVDEMHLFISHLSNWLMLQGNHYRAAGLELDKISFAYKFLSDEDSVLKLRTNKMKESTITNVHNFNKLINSIPLKYHYTDIEGAKLIKSKFETKHYLQGISLKNVLGLESLMTVWEVKELQIDGMKYPIKSVTIADSKTGNTIVEFSDIYKDKNDNNSANGVITRKFSDGSVITFDDEREITRVAKSDPNTVFMNSITKRSWEDVVKTNLLTFDIETREEKVRKAGTSNSLDPQKIIDPELVEYELDKSGEPIKKLHIISIALFMKPLHDITNPENKRSSSWFFVIQDYNSEKEMIHSFFKKVREISISVNRDIHLFAHNSALFDLIFILKYLITLDEEMKQNLNFLVRDGKFILVDWRVKTLKLNKDGKPIYVKVKFFDSLLMLPMSLAKAGKQFAVEEKGSIDFNKINECKSFEDLDKIRSELRLYNIQDCRVLWYVLAKYAKYTVDKFNVNIFKHPTAASIAFGVFRTNYLKQMDHRIPITSKHVYDKLSKSYMGGACDVYKPQNPEGTKVYTYDINSEYPAMMATKLMPTGIYQHVVGHINIEDPNLIGFVRARIIAPINLQVPLLPVRINGKLISGVGEWEGMYFSKELQYASTLGYKVEPYEAYIFEGKLVFNKFIENIYKERLSYPKSDPMNYICKLIMNSTYGRFGMAPLLTDVKLFDKTDVHNYNSGANFLDITNIDDKTVMVTSNSPTNECLDQENPNRNLQISLPIAAAITSYARICIHEYKLAAAKKGILLYSDTDSIITSAPLSEDLLGDQLGQLKLENIAEKGIFLSAKVYTLHNVEINGKKAPDIIKAKGLKGESQMEFGDYKRLIDKTKVYKTFQSKWFRDIGEATVRIQNLSAMVRINEGKRVIVTDLQDNFIDTWNVVFKGEKIISSNVVKIGLPVLYNNPNSIKLIGAPKTALISAPKSEEFKLICAPLDVIHLPAPQKLLTPILGKSFNNLHQLDLTKLSNQELYDIRFKADKRFSESVAKEQQRRKILRNRKYKPNP